MDASEHDAGCDLKHTPRQRCSSWEPPVAASTGAPAIGLDERPDSVRSWILWAGLPIWIILALGLALSLAKILYVLFGLGNPEANSLTTPFS